MLHGDMDWSDVFTTNPFLDPNLFGEWINLLHKTLGVDYSYGGWMEDREEILDGTYLESGHKIHLGVDYWVREDVPVHMPKNGKLVSARYDPDTNGGWGGQCIFEIDGMYVIFGHLKMIADRVGSTLMAGSTVGLVAGVDGSGGWYPHLHLQCMKTFEPTIDGYGAKDPFRFDNFPNPEESIHI